MEIILSGPGCDLFRVLSVSSQLRKVLNQYYTRFEKIVNRPFRQEKRFSNTFYVLAKKWMLYA